MWRAEPGVDPGGALCRGGSRVKLICDRPTVGGVTDRRWPRRGVRRGQFLLVAGVAGATGLAGCGGDVSGPSGDGSPADSERGSDGTAADPPASTPAATDLSVGVTSLPERTLAQTDSGRATVRVENGGLD
jgi:hypothetical protein